MIEMIIEQRRRNLGGGFDVGRVLPFAKRRMVGPFIFFDHMGPLDLAPADMARRRREWAAHRRQRLRFDRWRQDAFAAVLRAS